MAYLKNDVKYISVVNQRDFGLQGSKKNRTDHHILTVLMS